MNRKIPVAWIRVFLYLTAIMSFGLVVLNWWWAFFHDGYVVISFVEFGEMGFEFFLIHIFFGFIIFFTVIAIKRECNE